MNPLKKYLISENETESAFAKRSGVSQPTIWRFLNDKVNSLKPETALKIQKATGGLVTAAVLLRLEEIPDQVQE